MKFWHRRILVLGYFKAIAVFLHSSFMKISFQPKLEIVSKNRVHAKKMLFQAFVQLFVNGLQTHLPDEGLRRCSVSITSCRCSSLRLFRLIRVSCLNGGGSISVCCKPASTSALISTAFIHVPEMNKAPVSTVYPWTVYAEILRSSRSPATVHWGSFL